MVFQCQAAFVTLADANSQVLVEFYRQLFGIEPQPDIPNVYSEFQIAGLRLGIFTPKKSNEKEFSNQAKTTLSLCLQVNDLEAAIRHLHCLGYPPPGDILTASHGREIYAYDPTGNRLILYQPYSP